MMFVIMYRIFSTFNWAHTQILKSLLLEEQPVFIPVVELRGIQQVF